MQHIISGIAETLKEYEAESLKYAPDLLPGYRIKTAEEIFAYVLSELEINAEALRDREPRGMCYE